MNITAIGNVNSDGYIVSDGDIISIPDEIGKRWCSYGWAKDIDNNVMTEERNISDIILIVH
jgi:hypothetical protein